MNNIDIEILKRMETFAQTALKLFPEQREACFQEMIRNGIIEENEAKWLAEYVCLYRLMTDRRYYKAVEKKVGEMLLATFKQEG